MSEKKPNHKRLWWGLLVLGLLLHLSSISTSDYGLDTHLHLAALESNEDGTPNLEWGDVRPEDPSASNPSDEQLLERGWWQILELYPSWLLPFAAFLPVLALIGILLVIAKGQPHLAALVALHPSLIFATGRLYPESTVALAFAGIVVSTQHLFKQRGFALTQWAVLSIACIHLVVLVKGLNPTVGWGLIGVLSAWIVLDRTVPRFRAYSRNPLMALSIAIPSVLAVMIYASFTAGGSLATLQTHPVEWLFSLFIAVLDGFGLYLLVGLCCWPYLFEVAKKALHSRENHLVFVTSLIVSGTLLMSMWIASLWVFEADRWEIPLWKNMVLLGNNGRYLTALIFPLLYLIHWSMDDNAWAIGRPMMLALVLVLPLSMLAGMHGQSMWTDDAARSFSDEIAIGEDFLYIDDEPLAMHWLYTFRLEVDPEGDRNITGHWRAPESNWELELEGQVMNNRGDLGHVRYLVVAPNIDLEVPSGWEKTASGQAPYLNSGGEWAVYRAL